MLYQLRILEAERERERSQFLGQIADLQARLDREGEDDVPCKLSC